MDFGKLERAFPDLRIEWTAQRGAAQLAAAYSEAGLTTEQFNGDRYVRLRRIGRLLEAGELDDALRLVSGV